MSSTGNDIVALAATDEVRTCRHRFYSRILTPGELPLYDELSGLSFSTFVWLVWSIKESVYKYVSRSNPRLVFTPLKIPLTRVSSPLGKDGDYYKGVVHYGPTTLYSRSFVVPGKTVMTVVSEEEDFRRTRWGLHTIADPSYPNQSARVRAFALESLSMNFPDTPLSIVKAPDGPPEVWAAQRDLGIPISLAHHDRYVAWAYCLTANNSSYRKSTAN